MPDEVLRRALIQVLYLWTRDGRIGFESEADRAYIQNQVSHLGEDGTEFSDTDREDWAREVVKRLEQRFA